jgi:hypothetical protein
VAVIVAVVAAVVVVAVVVAATSVAVVGAVATAADEKTGQGRAVSRTPPSPPTSAVAPRTETAEGEDCTAVVVVVFAGIVVNAVIGVFVACVDLLVSLFFLVVVVLSGRGGVR